MRQRIDLDQYADALLLALFERVVSDEGDRIRKDEIGALLPGRPDGLVRLGIDRLEARGDVYSERSRQQQYDSLRDGYESVEVDFLLMSGEGFDRVNSWDDEGYYSVRAFCKPEEGRERKVEVPASDRVVTLNHNRPEYIEAVEALEKAIEEFDRDQCLDNELGPEKSVLRKNLESAREFLRLKEINVRIGMSMVVEPLLYIAKKYETAIAGAALSQFFRLAADKIVALFN